MWIIYYSEVESEVKLLCNYTKSRWLLLKGLKIRLKEDSKYSSWFLICI